MRCANCDAELVGEYCHACGQRAIGDDDLAVGPIVRNFADDLLHLDFKTVRSLVRIQTALTLFYGVSNFVTALLLKGRFRGRQLGAHLVFALHYVPFLYLAAIGLSALQKLTGSQTPLASLVFTYSAVVPYLFLSLRRSYSQSDGRTLANLLLICLVTFFVDNAVNFGSLILALWLV